MTPRERVAAVPFRRLVWLLPVAFTLHELEEWNILLWYRTQFVNPPSTSDRGVHVGLLAISLLGVLWTAGACLLPTPRATALVALPFFVVFVLGNALQHVYWQLAFGAYAPGVVTSALLIIPSVVLLSWHAVRSRLVAPAYLAVLYASSVAVVFYAVRAGRTVPSGLLAVHAFIEALARHLLGAP